MRLALKVSSCKLFLLQLLITLLCNRESVPVEEHLLLKGLSQYIYLVNVV